MDDNLIIFENFNTELNKQFCWQSPPKVWKVDPLRKKLIINTDKETDFWQRTHYGFQNDNGHFLYNELTGNFRITTKVDSYPKNQYDQAGLMVRFSENTWIKTSVEYIEDGNNKLGVVVTNNGYSDWSTQVYEKDDISLFHRISRKNNDYFVDYSLDGAQWTQIRITHLFEAGDKPIYAGVYACSPIDRGCEAHFDFIKIESITNETSVYL